jgi:hypothetical protein
MERGVPDPIKTKQIPGFSIRVYRENPRAKKTTRYAGGSECLLVG